MPANDVDYAWCAGFLDGEGHFYIGPARPESPALRTTGIRATQARHIAPIERLCFILGGSFFVPSQKTSSGKTVYVWQLAGGKNVRRVVPLLLPYLVNKKAEAEMLLAYANCSRPTRTSKAVPDDLWAKREAIVNQLKEIRNGSGHVSQQEALREELQLHEGQGPPRHHGGTR